MEESGVIRRLLTAASCLKLKWRMLQSDAVNTQIQKSQISMLLAQQVANVQKLYFPVFISAISPTFHPSTHFLNPFRVTRVRMWGWESDTGGWGTPWTDRKSFVVTVTPTRDVEQSGNLAYMFLEPGGKPENRKVCNTTCPLCVVLRLVF